MKSPEHVAAAQERAHDHLKNTRYAAPVKCSGGVMVKDAAELVAALAQKGPL